MKAATKSTKQEEKIVREAIKNFGPVINLKETPYVLIELLRKFGPALKPDGGLPPGGVGVGGPAVRQIGNQEIMKEILKLSREVNSLKATLKSPQKGAKKSR